MGSTHAGEVHGGVSSGRDPTLVQGTGAGEKSKEKGAAETTCDELIATPIHCPPCAIRVEEAEKLGSEVEPRKKG